MITSYDTLNTLPEISFIAGTDKLFTFYCYRDDGINLLNLGSGPIYWRLCPYGSFAIELLDITASITGLGTFTVTIPAADTITLNGKYIQQVTVTDYTGDTFKAAQGTIIIGPAIDQE